MSNWYTKPEGGWSFSSDNLFNIGSTNSLHYAGDDKTFLVSKTYLYRVKIKDLKSLQSNSIRLNTPWASSFNNIAFNDLSTDDGYINFYSTPLFRVDSSNNTDRFTGFDSSQFIDHYSYISITDDDGQKFGPTSGVISIDIVELDWSITGFSWIEADGLSESTTLNDFNKGNGWSYNSNSGLDYFEYLKTDEGINPASTLGQSNLVSSTFLPINHISRYVNSNNFNLEFTASLDDGSFDLYLSDDKPYTGTSSQAFDAWKSSADLIGSYSIQSVETGITHSIFFGLPGNKYVSFVATNTNTTQTIRISNLRVRSGYGQGNNRQYVIDPNFVASGLSGVTFSSFIGVGDTFNSSNLLQIGKITSKIGNGAFKAGMWENGVWNNGWRLDESVREFDDVDLSIQTLSDVRWRFRIIGASQSVSHFNLGDEVTIGNIIGIDINEKRRLIKDKFRIIGINPTGINERVGFIIVEIDTTFPIRRVERDSKKHKIKITKNGWLSGAFLNGYFTGVWNFGLFRGFPLITEMFETNWIDGIFNGGHLHSEYYINGTFIDVTYNDGKVGLTFSTPHNLAVGDVIEIKMDDQSINQHYNSETKVIQVLNDNELVTDIDYGIKKLNGSESGTFTSEIATSVIQNMDFQSNNVSRVTSIDSMNTEDVFIYNSWIDVNYSTQSAVNIGRPQTKISPISRKSFSENNLYGYPTDDVLSSNSSFRDSYSLRVRDYKLGNKWEIFNDFVGDSSNFTEFFGTSSEDTQLFLDQGWTFSKVDVDSITFSRTIDEGVKDITGEELKVEAVFDGGTLDIAEPAFNVNNRSLEPINRGRYTIIEFDLVTYSVVDKFFITLGNQNLFNIPFIHFNNINQVIRDIQIFGSVQKLNTAAEYLPIYKNVDHVKTKKRKKVEFFFNKRNLSMNFTGGGGPGNNMKSEFIINNLKMYEVDMIPFFQYFTEFNINKSIQIPLQGIAPYIDYENSDFSFIDNISIGLDSISLVSSTELFSGVGPGVISNGPSLPIASELLSVQQGFSN